MIRFLFKIPPHKTFTHTPIYFNPQQEDLKRRVAEAEGINISGNGRLSKGTLRETWGRSSRLAQGNKSSNIRLVLIVLVLILVAWLLFYK